MIAEADTIGNNSDGQVSFEEFKLIAFRGAKLQTSKLWKPILEKNSLSKGARNAMGRLDAFRLRQDQKFKQDVKNSKAAEATRPAGSLAFPKIELPHNTTGSFLTHFPVQKPVIISTAYQELNMPGSVLKRIKSSQEEERILAYKGAATGGLVLSLCALYRKMVTKI